MPNDITPPILTEEEQREAKIITSPWLFAEAFLQNPVDPHKPLRLRRYQRSILKDRHYRRLLRMGRRCVAATDTIYTPDGPYSFKDLLVEHPPIWTLTADDLIVETTDYSAWDNGAVETLQITTITGKTQQTSRDHPFLVRTSNGPQWVEAQDLTVSSQIAVPNTLSFGARTPDGPGPVTSSPVYEIPRQVYAASPTKKAAFLASYWSTAGWIQVPTEAGVAPIGASATTHTRAAALQHLLLCVGIHSSIQRSPTTTGWTVEVRENTSIRLFCTKIVPTANIEPLLGTPEFPTDGPGNIRWERVASIVDTGLAQTIDLEVPRTHCFLGADIISHNTGKTVLLAIEAVYRAFTYANRRVLVVTAYEGQLDELFTNIDHLCFDSDKIRDSIVRVTLKPHKVEFLNGSTIIGNVGNNSVRGKCLPHGTYIWMEDLSWKLIEEIEPGERVISWNFETNQAESSAVTAVHDNGVRPVFEVSTRSGRFLHATDNHKLFTRQGEEITVADLRSWHSHQGRSHFITALGIDVIQSTTFPAGLTVNQHVIRRQYARVNDVKALGEQPTKDLTVENNHNYVALFPPDIDNGPFNLNKISNGGLLVHNSADDLIIDECDYIPEPILLEAIWPIGTTTRDTTVILSSTPSGRHEFFYNVSQNASKRAFNFHEFHIPSSESPEWTPEHEALVRATTDNLRYTHEYEARFGDSAEGVFRNRHIDPSLFVYGYDDIQVQPDSFLSMGVDWNEAAAGVRIVLLEHVIMPTTLQPYNSGQPEKAAPITIRNFLRVAASYKISSEDYTNTVAVDFILGLLGEFPIDYACFDRGHGHTNWELLRLAISRGVSATGKSCTGLTYMLDRMEVVDFGGTTEVIDVTTNTVSKVRTKNLLVRDAVKLLENGRYVIPAVDKQGTTVELEQDRLIGQMREYSVLRTTERGEVFSKGNDHVLDAWMLATHGFMLKHDKFIAWDYSTTSTAVHAPALNPSGIARTTLAPQRNQSPQPTTSIIQGIPVTDHGIYTKPGEPPDPDDRPRLIGGVVNTGRKISRSVRHTPRKTSF